MVRGGRGPKSGLGRAVSRRRGLSVGAEKGRAEGDFFFSREENPVLEKIKAILIERER